MSLVEFNQPTNADIDFLENFESIRVGKCIAQWLYSTFSVAARSARSNGRPAHSGNWDRGNHAGDRAVRPRFCCNVLQILAAEVHAARRALSRLLVELPESEKLHG